MTRDLSLETDQHQRAHRVFQCVQELDAALASALAGLRGDEIHTFRGAAFDVVSSMLWQRLHLYGSAHGVPPSDYSANCAAVYHAGAPLLTEPPAKLPPVLAEAGGRMRLYRGEKPDPVSAGRARLGWEESQRGRWYTPRPCIAALYAGQNGGEVYYVDVTADMAHHVAWSYVRRDHPSASMVVSHALASSRQVAEGWRSRKEFISDADPDILGTFDPSFVPA